MAELLSCPVCAGKVSSDAPFCPHCGHPMKPGVPESMAASASVPIATSGSGRPKKGGGMCGCLFIVGIMFGTVALAFWVIGGG